MIWKWNYLPEQGEISINPASIVTCDPGARRRGTTRLGERNAVWFILYYVAAISILILHFTGFLARHNLDWLVLVLAATVFPAVIYL
jgi:hypothetical protein